MEPAEFKIEVFGTDTMPNMKGKGHRQERKKLLKERKEEEKYQRWFAEEVEEIITVDLPERPLASESACCIFTVPKTLKGLKGKKAAYEPQIFSFGPFHFLKNAEIACMEKIKSEVASSIQVQLNIRHGERDFFSKVVELIKLRENWIKDCYDRKIHVSSAVLAWMMARDASFILQFLRQRLFTREITENLMRDIESLPLVDTLKDIAKLENQIPLLVLRILRQIEMEMKITNKEERATGMGKAISDDKLGERGDEELEDILEKICMKLSPFLKGKFRLKEEKHILECLRSYVVGNIDKQTSNRDQEKFNYLDALVYYAFQTFLRILYIIMYPCIWKSKNALQTILQPAVELHKAGVQFHPSVGGIQGIRFDERRSILYLPEIKVDIHTDTIMRNIMAFELCSSTCKDKAVTRYAHLMDQLINTEKDVALLSKHGIISNKLENDSKVADFWNSLTDSTSVPKYEPIDKATEDLKSYYQRRRTTLVILWNEFLESHCSKPWHVLALVASIVLLVITISTGFLRIFPALMRQQRHE